MSTVPAAGPLSCDAPEATGATQPSPKRQPTATDPAASLARGKSFKMTITTKRAGNAPLSQLPEGVGRKWAAAIQELVDTERAYVSELMALLEKYHDQLPDEVMGLEEKSIVFGNLPEMLSFQCEFLESLESCALKSPESIGRLFLDAAGFISIYSTYCANYPRAAETLKARRDDTVLQQHLVKAAKSCEHQLSLEDYLLQPVQRVFRYPLLLEAQQKACGEGLVGQTDLAAAVEMMREVSHTINTAKRESELQSIVNGTVAITRSKPLQDRLQGLAGDLSSYGDLVNEAEFTLLSGARSHRHLFLFKGAMLECKLRSDGALSVKSMYQLNLYRLKKLNEHTMAVEHVITDDRKAFYNKLVDVTVWVSQWGVLVQSYNPSVVTNSQKVRLVRGSDGSTSEQEASSAASSAAGSPLKRLQASFEASDARSGRGGSERRPSAAALAGEPPAAREGAPSENSPGASLASRRASHAAEVEAVREKLLASGDRPGSAASDAQLRQHERENAELRARLEKLELERQALLDDKAQAEARAQEEKNSRQRMEEEMSGIVKERLEETKVRAKQLVEKARAAMQTAEERAVKAENAVEVARRQAEEARVTRRHSEKRSSEIFMTHDTQLQALKDHQQLADEATTQFALAKARLRDALAEAQAIATTSELSLRAENDRRLESFVAGIAAERAQLEQAQAALLATAGGPLAAEGTPSVDGGSSVAAGGESVAADTVAAALASVENEANRLQSRHRSATITSKSRECTLLAEMEEIKSDYESIDFAWGDKVRQLQDETQRQLADAEARLQRRISLQSHSSGGPDSASTESASAVGEPPVEEVAAEVAETCYKVQIASLQSRAELTQQSATELLQLARRVRTLADDASRERESQTKTSATDSQEYAGEAADRLAANYKLLVMASKRLHAGSPTGPDASLVAVADGSSTGRVSPSIVDGSIDEANSFVSGGRTTSFASVGSTHVQAPTVPIDLTVVLAGLLPPGQPAEDMFLEKTSFRGYMIKRGAVHKNWTKRWFVLDVTKQTLSYFTDARETKLRGRINFSSFYSVAPHRDAEAAANHTILLGTPNRTYQFQAPTELAMRAWVRAMQAVLA